MLVAGAGVSGTSAAEVLVRLGARVTVVDRSTAAADTGRAAALEALGATVLLGDAAPPAPSTGTGLVVTSPGWRPDSPLLRAAAAAGIPVWGDVELAWRLRSPAAAPWLALTGTNGKTTTVRMLTAMLAAAGLRAVAAGNVGTPLTAAAVAMDANGRPAADVLAVELSSFQLHWSLSVVPAVAALLNVAPDHLDWHGSFEAYAADKARIWAEGTRVAVGNADDGPSSSLLAASPPPDRRTFTLGVPTAGQLGVEDGRLVDRTGVDLAGVDLAGVGDVRPGGPHNVANALAAAALARAYGVPPAAVTDGLRAFRPEPHRNTVVAEALGVSWVDDSKATNPHAAAASLAGYDRVVWVAGGLDKGLPFGDLVRESAGRLRGVVLLGACRGVLREALARHAPKVPVVEVTSTETGAMTNGAMTDVVRAAARLAEPGDTVLLAPAAASMDMFRDYAERGDAFAAAVRALHGGRS